MASSSVDEEEVTEEAISYYPYLLLAVSCAGIFSNVASLFVFARQRFRKMFHQLLVLLALYDFMVSIFLEIGTMYVIIWISGNCK